MVQLRTALMVLPVMPFCTICNNNAAVHQPQHPEAYSDKAAVTAVPFLQLVYLS